MPFHTIIEPFRIHSTQRIRHTTSEEREAALAPAAAWAQTTEEIVHTVWIATCAGLVLMM